MCLDALTGSRYFCSLDLASGYWQMGVFEPHREKTAFVTHKGLFQFKVMPFGLTNGPASFERLMEVVLRGLVWEQCLLYLDDIMVFGKDVDEVLDRLTTVFMRLRQADLKMKPAKCFLFQTEVSFLGHKVSAAGVSCDPAKIDSITKWGTPQNVTDVRSFMGTANYYRRYIPNFAEISEPLRMLTRKQAVFEWTDECELAFSTLKEKLTTAPVLAYLRMDCSYLTLMPAVLA